MGPIFLCSTLRAELPDVRAEVATFLRAGGLVLIRSEDPDFHRGSGEHKHDVCLRRVDEIPGFLLIIDKWAGRDYGGEREEYAQYLGLTITHAETKRAWLKDRGWYCFARHEVLVTYNLWKKNGCRSDFESDVEPKVFQLLDDVYQSKKWDPIAFDDLSDLKPKLEKMFLLSTI